MKKILAIVMSVVMVMALSVTAFAAETEVALTLDNIGYCGTSEYADSVTEVDGGLNTSAVAISILLPESVEFGDSITIHTKGTSEGAFRIWLSNEEGHTDSEPWISSSRESFDGGEFDFTITLKMNDNDGNLDDYSDQIIFKGIDYQTPLENLTITYLAIVTEGEEEEVVAETTDDADAAEETTTTANADTGVVLAVLPMAVAAAAVVVSKRR
ncbi:MAG: hypothetical protein LIO72_08565 [Ruminococcus sp.]|nr:hypothetical protein [Ruminococcus sp.]